MTNLGGNILNNVMIRVGADSFFFLVHRAKGVRHENVEDARRLDALVRLHSTVLDPDIEN